MVRRVVVSALEVVPAGFVVVDVAAVAEGVAVDESVYAGGVTCGGGGGDVAPGVVGVSAEPLLLIFFCFIVPYDPEEAFHITLGIGGVEVGSEIAATILRVGDGEGSARLIIDEVHDDGGISVGEGLPHQLAVLGDVGMHHAVYGLLGADTVHIVGIGGGVAADRDRGQVSALLPSQVGVTLLTVIIAGRVAGAVIAKGLGCTTVYRNASQQITPLGVGVRIDLLCLGGCSDSVHSHFVYLVF